MHLRAFKVLLLVVHHPRTFLQHEKRVVDQATPLSHGPAVHLSFEVSLRASEIDHTEEPRTLTIGTRELELQNAVGPRGGFVPLGALRGSPQECLVHCIAELCPTGGSADLLPAFQA